MKAISYHLNSLSAPFKIQSKTIETINCPVNHTTTKNRIQEKIYKISFHFCEEMRSKPMRSKYIQLNIEHNQLRIISKPLK